MTDDPARDHLDREDPRLQSLDRRLAEAQHAERTRTGRKRGQGKGYSQGNRVLAELVAGPAGGAVIGWTLDHFIGTGPWLLLVFLVLGIVVAGRNIFRIANERPE